MPYKARLKQGEARKREKTEYRVTNARAYNLSLKKRGMISLYLPSGELKAQFINAKPYTRGVSGREPTYTAGYIELITRSTGCSVGHAPDHQLDARLLGDARIWTSGAQQPAMQAVRSARSQRHSALRHAGQTARARRGGEHDCRRHGAELRTSQSVVRTEVQPPGHAYAMAQDALGNRRGHEHSRDPYHNHGSLGQWRHGRHAA
jgi:hypothetical protein